MLSAMTSRLFGGRSWDLLAPLEWNERNQPLDFA